MKVWIQTTPDFDYEVVDVFLVIDIEYWKRAST